MSKQKQQQNAKKLKNNEINIKILSDRKDKNYVRNNN